MKRNNRLTSLFFSILLAGSVLSCTLISDIKNFEKPESVTLKSTGSVYSVPLGNATAFLSDHVYPDLLESLIAENSKNQSGSETKIEVYDFNDIKEQTVQKYIFNYPVNEIPLDLSSYLSKYDQLNIGADSDNSFSQVLKADCKDSKFSKDIDIDFDEMIRNEISCSVDNIVIPQTGTASPDPYEVKNIWISFTEPEFSTIEFKNGSLELKLKETAESDTGDGVEISIKAILYDKNGDLVSSSGDDPVSVYNSGTINTLSIPMTGKVLTNKVYMTFITYCANGTPGNFSIFNMDLGISDDAKISKITNLTVKDSALEPYYISVDESVNTDELKATLKTAKISEGSINYYLKLPAGWSGITANPSVSASGDITVAPSDFKSVSDDSCAVYKTASLADKTITPDAGIHFTGNVPFKIQNATIVINDVNKLQFFGEASLKKLKDVKIYASKLADADKLKKDISVALGDDIKTYVESVTFEKVGLEGTINTNLPSSDMVLDADISSTFFALAKNDKVKFSQPAPHKLSMVEEYADGLEKQLTSDIDFKINMALSGSDEGDPDLITISSFELGKEYSFDFDVNLVYEWKEITLITDAKTLSGNFDSGFNFKAILGDSLKDSSGIDKVVDNTNFQSGAIEGKFYVTRPDLDNLEDFSGFTGSIKCDFGTGEKYLFPDDGSTEKNVDFVKVKKTFAEMANSKKQITDISGVSVSGELDSYVLTDMFNSKATINLSYSLALSGAAGKRMTVKREEIERLKRNGYSTSIKASFAIILSLKLETVNDVEFDDVFTMFGKGIEEDLFGREGADEESDYKKYSEMIEKLTLEYLFTNNTGFKVDTYLISKNADGEKYFGWNEATGTYTKPVKIKTGTLFDWSKDKTRLGISRSEIESLFNNYPFIPQLTTVIPGSQSIIVPRNAYFAARAVFVAETKGEYKIWGGEDD